MKRGIKQINTYLSIVLFTTFSLGLIKIFSLIPFNRMAGDDFSYGYTAKSLGFIESQKLWYMNWTGRYSSTFMQITMGKYFGGDGNITIYTVITITLLLFSFFVFHKTLFKQKYNKESILSVGAMMAVLYAMVPDKNESIYYMSGSITYLWPIILSLLIASLLVRNKITRNKLVLIPIFSIIMTGFNEGISFLTAITSTILMFLQYYNNLSNKSLHGLLEISALKKIPTKYKLFFIFSLLGSLIMYFAPGNANRGSGASSDNMNIIGSIAYSIQMGPAHLYNLVKNHTALLFGSFLISGYLMSFTANIKLNKETIGSHLTKIFFLISMPLIGSIFYLIPSYYILGRLPPERSDITLSFIVVLSIVVASKYLSETIKYLKLYNKNTFNIIILFAAFIVLISSFRLVDKLGSDLYIARDYSIAYDQMHSSLTRASKLDQIVVIQKLPESGLIHSAQLSDNKDHWYNNAVSDYFDLQIGVISENH